MQTTIGSRGLQFGVIAAAALLLPTFFLAGFLGETLSTQGFLPHSYCFTWQPGVIWLNAGSDATIGPLLPGHFGNARRAGEQDPQGDSVFPGCSSRSARLSLPAG